MACPSVSAGSGRGDGPYLEMAVHSCATGEIALKKMDNGETGAGSHVEHLLLILDLTTRASAGVAQSTGASKFFMQLIEALLAKGVQLGVVLVSLEGSNKGVLVVRAGG